LQTFRWNSSGIGANFVEVPIGSQVLIKGNFSYSKYDIKLKEKAIVGESAKDRFSKVGAFNFGIDFTFFLNKNELNYGIEVTRLSTIFKFVNDNNQQSNFEKSSTELAGFIRYKFTYGKLILDPSIRFQYYAVNTLNKLSPEPRISAKYLITDRLRFKSAAGIYSQNLLSGSDDRDIVNLFYGFITTPEKGTYTTSFKQPKTQFN
jgi:hypothetical protein